MLDENTLNELSSAPTIKSEWSTNVEAVTLPYMGEDIILIGTVFALGLCRCCCCDTDDWFSKSNDGSDEYQTEPNPVPIWP